MNYGLSFNSFTYSDKIIAWQTAMKSHITKQHIMLDLNMSSRNWSNCDIIYYNN